MKSYSVFIVPSPDLFLLTESKKFLFRNFDIGNGREGRGRKQPALSLLFSLTADMLFLTHLKTQFDFLESVTSLKLPFLELYFCT